MNDSVAITPKRAAGFFGAAFSFVFLMMYDPDAMPPGMLSASKWLVLLPAAFLLALRPSIKPWSSGLVLAGGVFVGVCLAAILHSSNLWPIAGVYWTAVWLPPIAIGSVAGILVARRGRRAVIRGGSGISPGAKLEEQSTPRAGRRGAP